MSRAIVNYNFDADAIAGYFVSLLDMEDKKNLFKKDFQLWHDFISLIIQAFKFYSEEEKFDFTLVFEDLTGKIPYNGRRKKIEKEGGDIIFSLFSDSVVDYLYNLKIDPGRRNIIKATAGKFKEDSRKALKKLLD